MLRAKGYWIGGGLSGASQQIVQTLFTAVPEYLSCILFFFSQEIFNCGIVGFATELRLRGFFFVVVLDFIKLSGDSPTERGNLQALKQII